MTLFSKDSIFLTTVQDYGVHCVEILAIDLLYVRQVIGKHLLNKKYPTTAARRRLFNGQ